MDRQQPASEIVAKTKFRILGPLEIHGNAGPIQLDAQRQRIVLAMLLLEANRTLPIERLIDAVWDESPPPTAKGQIQICVSAVRRAFTAAGLPQTIRTRPPGYLLNAAPDELDLHRFVKLSADACRARDQGRLADAGQTYREALALWYGEPLAGLGSRLVQAAALQVTEQLLTAMESCFDVELRLGRHRELVGELMHVVTIHPLREKLLGQLMVALYRSGRQAEALSVYRQARNTLAEDHGLEPGDALRRLELAVLTGSAELELPGEDRAVIPLAHSQVRGVPRLLPSDIADFAGRDDLLLRLQQILAPVADGVAEPGAIPVVAIAGRGGVGKTTLAVHLAHRVLADFPDGQLFAHLHGTESRPPNAGRILERFLRALGVAPSGIPEDTDERAELFRDRLAGRRVLVVLDDVATEHQMMPLLPGSGSCAVIVTSRLRQTGLASATHVDLDVLDADQAIEMFTNVIGRERVDAEPSAALELVDLCGRLPLAIRIAGARLAARPHWQIDQLRSRLTDSMRRLDELTHRGLAVRPSIAVSYQSLGPGAQKLFRRLSILETPEFATWVAAPLLDEPVDVTEDLLETLVDVRLLDAEQTDGQVRYHFHDLIRVYAREQLIADRQPEQPREALGRALGAWLYLAVAAHRRLYGGDYTVLHGKAPLWTLSGEITDELLADPMQWLEAERTALVIAVRQAAEAGFHELAWDLAMTTVTLFEAHSHFDDWRETTEVSLSACRHAGNRLGEAAMLYSLGSLSLVNQRFTDATRWLDEALSIFDELGDVHGEALALRNLAYLDRVQGAPARALERYEQSLAGLRRTGDLVGEAHVLSGIAQIRLDGNDLDAAHRLLSRALAIARNVGSERVQSQILLRIGDTQRERHDLSGAEETYRSVLRLVRIGGDAVGECYALYGLGRVQVHQRHYAEAAGTLDSALELAQRHAGPLLTARLHLVLVELFRASRQPSSAVDHLRVALGMFERLGAQAWRVSSLAQLGELAGELETGPNGEAPSD